MEVSHCFTIVIDILNYFCLCKNKLFIRKPFRLMMLFYFPILSITLKRARRECLYSIELYFCKPRMFGDFQIHYGNTVGLN